MMAISVNDLDSDIPCPGGGIHIQELNPFKLLDCHLSPIKVPPQAKKMIEKVIGRSNVVEEAPNRIRVEGVGFH